MADLKLSNDPLYTIEGFDGLFLEDENFARNRIVMLLNLIQEHYGFLSSNSLNGLSEKMGLSLNEICSVASFYDRFRFSKGGRFSIEVCVGTACHVKGAEKIFRAFSRSLGIEEGGVSDDGLFDIKRVACLGCCMMAPAVKIGKNLYGPLTPSDCGNVIDAFLKSAGGTAEEPDSIQGGTTFMLCDCSSCKAAGATELRRELQKSLKTRDGWLKRTACPGNSAAAPVLTVIDREGGVYNYHNVKLEQLKGIVSNHAAPKDRLARFAGKLTAVENWILGCSPPKPVPNITDSSLIRIATDGAGKIGPLDVDEYIGKGGFSALSWACEQGGDIVVETLQHSDLRGRGGGGYRTADKWRALLGRGTGEAVIICNADEGDPGAFMDRILLESFPFRVVEGVLIAALTLKADRVIFYVRCEYPLAIERLKEALEILRERSIIKDGMDVQIMEGAGAFVCGEETALLNSLEGRRGIPRRRPPYPTESGFENRPTLINNVETFSIVPWICQEGAEAFAAMGTETSRGTKTFALAGKIKGGGLIEVPLGSSIGEIIEKFGSGLPEGSELKAVQIGGPSGGCIPASLAHLPVDYEALQGTGAMMGSGGLVVLDQFDCIVDLSRYFMDFCRKESCGRCLWCRTGTEMMYRMLDTICRGRGTYEGLAELERVAEGCRNYSQCGLGRSAPNPLLTSLKYFRKEYEAHIEGHCPAGVCRDLLTFRITGECIGCGMCSDVCADSAIAGHFRRYHSIDQSLCSKCGSCIKVCHQGAIHVE